MNRKTRYFVIASLLVLGIGVGVGLVAYYVGVPTAFAQQGPDELQLVPGNAVVVAYASVHEVMASNLRERVWQALLFLFVCRLSRLALAAHVRALKPYRGASGLGQSQRRAGAVLDRVHRVRGTCCSRSPFFPPRAADRCSRALPGGHRGALALAFP